MTRIDIWYLLVIICLIVMTLALAKLAWGWTI